MDLEPGLRLNIKSAMLLTTSRIRYRIKYLFQDVASKTHSLKGNERRKLSIIEKQVHKAKVLPREEKKHDLEAHRRICCLLILAVLKLKR